MGHINPIFYADLTGILLGFNLQIRGGLTRIAGVSDWYERS